MPSFTTKTEDYELLTFRGYELVTFQLSGQTMADPKTTGQLWPRGKW